MEAACKELTETVCTCILYDHIQAYNFRDEQIFMAKMMARCNDDTGELNWNMNKPTFFIYKSYTRFPTFFITFIYLSSRKLAVYS